MYGRLLGWYAIYMLYMHFWGALPPNGILPDAKFPLHPSVAFLYIGSITAWHLNSGHQPNFAAWYFHQSNIFAVSSTVFSGGCHLCLEGGHHIGHSPTF